MARAMKRLVPLERQIALREQRLGPQEHRAATGAMAGATAASTGYRRCDNWRHRSNNGASGAFIIWATKSATGAPFGTGRV
jgi:hypothetical protein